MNSDSSPSSLEPVWMSPPTSYRCPTCKRSGVSDDSRNLVVFIDGTSNKSGPKKTNVKKLYDTLPNDDLKQPKCYFEGIGAYDDNLPLTSRVGCTIKSGFEMAFACTVGKNVKKAYRWLAKLYQEGDRMYLFGFSRGGYQVRALAGIIHEVGLLRKPEAREERIEQAYRRYISIDPNNLKTKEEATQFKKDFCREGVRVHFVGVWDTVSSLRLIKAAVHITSSASVTNACHFRHALALDERRVKFMPEYFSEVNARRSDIRTRRAAIGGTEKVQDVRETVGENEVNDVKEVGDVKEVWFAGSHSDVGGMSRPPADGVPNLTDGEHHAIHSGNVPLIWMRREAAAKGLLVEPETSTWHPEDIDFGRKDTMKGWRIFEVIRIYHQISFSGTGKHAWRKHGYRPRSVIPTQQIHFSVFSGDIYAPRGTLAHRIDIPIMPPSAGGPWPTPRATELPGDEGMTSLLTLLLNNEHKTLGSLGEILFLLDFRLSQGQNQINPKPEWLEISIGEHSGFNKFALTVIHDVVCTENFSTSEERVAEARGALKQILGDPDHLDFHRTLYIVRLSVRHGELCRRFIAHTEVAQALILAVEHVPRSSSKDAFPLVTESLCHLIDGENRVRDHVVDQLTARVNEKTRLLLTLETKAPNHLVASLAMIATLAKHLDSSRGGEELQSKIIDLAKGRSPVGSAAVEALVALTVTVPHDVHISSIIGYLSHSLPRLDVEIDNAPLPQDINELPRILQVNGSAGLDDGLMQKLVSTTTSWDTHLRTAATLTLLKLCHNSTIRRGYSRPMLNIFMKQLERQKTSLLAAYALMVCLKCEDMWTTDDFTRAAPLVVAMVDKGWFDDAIGRVEGKKVFGELMASDHLRGDVLGLGIVDTLQKQLEGSDHHKTRMSLICLEIFWQSDPTSLTRILDNSLIQLVDVNKNVQKKGARTLSALARTKIGEKAILPRVPDIVRMLFPPPEGHFQTRSQLFGPIAAVYGLCRNETLRECIKESSKYKRFMQLRKESPFYPPISNKPVKGK